MMHSISPIAILKDNYVWAIHQNHYAAIIDPGEAENVQRFLDQHQLKLAAILITHHHGDHTNGITELTNQWDVPVYGSMQESVRGITHPLTANSCVDIASMNLSLSVLSIPGHTRGHIAYYGHDMLFCGDTLFAAGCGRIFEGTPQQMFQSLQTLKNLPDNTQVFCGHEYTLNNLAFAATAEPSNIDIFKRIEAVTAIRNQGLPSLPSLIKIEKEVNPFLRCDSPEIIANVEKYADKKLVDPVEVFQYLREWKNHF